MKRVEILWNDGSESEVLAEAATVRDGALVLVMQDSLGYRPASGEQRRIIPLAAFREAKVIEE